MNNPMKTIQRVLLLFLAFLMVICTLQAQINRKTKAWGTPVNGLQMSLSLGRATVPPLPIPAITLSLRNVGSRQLSVVIGASCGRAEVDNPKSVILTLTDSSGSSKRLVYWVPESCAGGMSFYAVPLRPGAVYSVPLKLDNYRFLTDTLRPEQVWRPGGTYSLQAELEGEPPAKVLNAWSGLVTSNKLSIHFPSR